MPAPSARATRVLYAAQKAMERKDPGKAVRLLEEFLASHPKQDHCLVEFVLGNALYASGDKEQALARYQRAVERDPGYGPAWVNLGQVAYEQKRYGLAAEALVKGFGALADEQEEERSPDLLYYGAVAYVLAGRPGDAVPILEDLVSGRHGEPKREWFQALLDAYLRQGREGRAEGLIRELLRRYGEDPESWRLLYRFEAARKNYERAAVALTIAGYLKPLTREEEILLGDLYATIRVPLLACEHYEKAFASGASPEEYERLASAYIAAHRPGDARRILVRALGDRPTGRLWSLLGDLRYMDEDYEGAYEAFRKAARLNPTDGRAYLMMGICALQMHDTVRAQEALRRAESFPAQRGRARGLLEQVEQVRSQAAP